MKPLYLYVMLAGCNQTALTGSKMTAMLLAASLGESPAVIGLLAALYGLVSAFVAVQVGRWIDRAGPRRPIMLASCMVTLSALIAAIWHNIPALFISAPVMGLFNSMFQMTSQQTVGRYGEPRERAANFSMLALAISGATFVGPMIAGLAIDHLDYANAFLVLAGVAFVPAVVVGMGVIEFPSVQHTSGARTTPVSGWALLKDKALRRAYIAAATNNAMWSIWVFVLPLYGHSIDLSATAIGTLAASLSIGTLIIRLFAIPLIRRYRPWTLIVVSHVVIAVGFFAMPLTREYVLLAALAFAVGVGLGLTGPMANTVMYDASPSDKVGEVIGLRMTMANMAQTLVPLLSGAVGATLGVAPVFWAVAACLAWEVWTNKDELRRHKAG